MDPSATLPTDARIGPWRVVAALAQGSTGTVYAAADAHGARAAVKVLRAARADDPVAHARFVREVALVRGLDHPSLVRVVDAGELPDGRPWFAMPLLRGETLAAAIARDGARAPGDAWAVLRPIADALRALHAVGVVHRDVKPENVLLAAGADGVVRPTLLDLGLARPVTASSAALTATGSMTGTPAYMPPEQWWGEGVGPASDQYALGVTAWELLTGSLPFPQRALDALMRAHREEIPTAAGLPAAATAWLARCLAKSPAARFPSMDALIEAGDAAFGAYAPTVAWAPWAAGAGVLASLVACGYQGEHSPREWMHLAGWASWPTVALGVAGAAAFALRPGRRDVVNGLAAAALLSGAAGTWSGFGAIERGLPRAPVTAQFEIFHLGVSEANANRYLAAGLALALGAATLLAGRAPRATDASLHRAVAWGGLATAAVVTAIGAPSAAFPCEALALAGAARVEGVARGAQGVALVLLGAAVGATRVESRASVVWAEAPDRASRVRELLAAQGERGATLALAAAALAVAVGMLWRARRGPSSRGGRAALACVALWGVLEAGHEARVALRRRALYGALAPQFAVLARLDPPVRAGLPTPSAAPSLRVARDVIAIDDQRVGLHSALDAEVGRGALALDLSHRLAREGASADGGAQLSVMADAQVGGAVVRRALAVAWGVGVRRAEVLFTRGSAPGTLPPGAPEEAAWVLPRDFVALPVTLGAEGVAIDDGRRFGEQAARWARGVTLAVGR